MTAAPLALEGHHPADWSEFVGQESAKSRLITAARAAKSRNQRMAHTLIACSTPGIGKTSLALLTSQELGRPVKVVSGTLKFNEARILLAMMGDGDTLIIEEIHRMVVGGKANAEWLLHYLQNDVLVGPFGPEPAPKVTILATTTDAGKLPPPLLQRFIVQPQLHPYTDTDGALIAVQLAGKILPPGVVLPSVAVSKQIARAASNQPREMVQILSALSDLVAIGTLDGTDPEYDLAAALDWVGVTEDGLTSHCQAYLTVLVQELMGAPAGAKMMSERLGLVGAELSETERLLLNKGYIRKTPAGRMITGPGIQRARTLLEAKEETDE